MHWLKVKNLNPGRSIAPVVGAMCGDSLFAYRAAGNEPTQETPPPR
jgi:hypothetical protein